MTRVALIALYNFDDLGIRTLHSLLKDNGHESHSIFIRDVSVNHIEPIDERDILTLKGLIEKIRPELIGIKVGSSFFLDAKRITEEIKSHAPVVWGGIHPTICPDECIENTDIICIGEGEYPMLDLADAIGEGGDISEIKNLWVRKDGRLFRNDIRPLVENLDEIPFPTFFDERQYYVNKGNLARNIHETESGTNWIMANGIYPIMTSRGCFFSCTYCCNNLLRDIYHGKGKYVRRRSVRNVIEELSVAKSRYRIKSIFFHDDIFTFDEEWISDFCREYKKRIRLPFTVMIHPKFSDIRQLSILSDAGLRGVKMGIQAGSSRIRSGAFNRKETNTEILDADKNIHKLGLSVIYDFIIDNPLESEEDKKATLDLLTKLNRPFKTNLYSLINFPRYRLTEHLLESSLIKETDIESKKQKVFDNWHINPKKTKSAWSYLILMAQMNIIPRHFLTFISRRRFIMKRPKLLMYAVVFLYITYYMHVESLFLRRYFPGRRPMYRKMKTRISVKNHKERGAP